MALEWPQPCPGAWLGTLLTALLLENRTSRFPEGSGSPGCGEVMVPIPSSLVSGGLVPAQPRLPSSLPGAPCPPGQAPRLSAPSALISPALTSPVGASALCLSGASFTLTLHPLSQILPWHEAVSELDGSGPGLWGSLSLCRVRGLLGGEARQLFPCFPATRPDGHCFLSSF